VPITVADLYGEYEEKVHGYAMKLARDPQAAEDLVQETFIRALGHLPLLAQLNHHQRRTWLYQTLKHLFLDQRAARLRETAMVERLAREVETSTTPGDSELGFDPFDLVPEADRELLEKRYGLGLSSREIAGELGIPAATVRTRLHLAVKKLRARKKKFL
jgi:RNA polymerase sigma-70 factor (ECF subfamily)